MIETPGTKSIDQSVPHAVTPLRRILFLLSALCLIISFIGGATIADTMAADTTANLADVAKIVTVTSFVCGMISLALGMTADAFWP